MATYQVGADGKAQSGLKAGDEVVTAGGTYKITGVNADGTYQSTLSNKNQTTNNYTGGYAGSTSSGGGSSSSGGITTATGKTYATGNATYSDYEGGTKRGVKDQVADIGRHPELANQSVYRDGYVHHYDEDGYLKYAEKSESPSYAGHTDLTKDKYGYTTDKNMWTDEQMMSAADLNTIAGLRAQAAAGQISWAEANAQANALRNKYGYTITQDGTVVDQNAVDRATEAQQNTGATSYYDKDTGTYRPIVSAPATNVGTVTQAPAVGTTTPTTGTAAPQVSMPDLPGLSMGRVEAPKYGESVELPVLGGGTVALPEYDLSGLTVPQLGGTQIAMPELGGAPIQAPVFETGEVTVGSVPQHEVGDYSQYIKDLYAANVEAELAALEDAYKTNVGTLESAGERIGKTYQAAQNAAAAQGAVAKRNMQEVMAANGLNTGTSGQMALAQSAALQGQLGALSAQEAQAITDNQREQDELSRQYQAAIVQAKASGNSALAAALYEEMIRQDSARQTASQLAQQQANWEAQFALSQQQGRNELLQQQYANALAQQQYADTLAQQNYENQFNQQQYQDSLAIQQYQQELALQQYKDQLAQQGYENAFNQQQYQDSIAQQQYQNEVAQKQYADQLLQQEYENAFAQQQYQNQLAQQEYENLFGQQQYRDQQTQQSFENDLLLRQYEDALAQQAYENALAGQKVTSSGYSGGSVSSGGSGGTAPSGAGEYALYLDAMNSGMDPRTYVKNSYKQYGLSSLPNESAYTDWSANLPDQLGSSAFRTWLNKVNINLSESTLDSVDKMVSQYWPVLTDAQRESVQQLFSDYGQTYRYE